MVKRDEVALSSGDSIKYREHGSFHEEEQKNSLWPWKQSENGALEFLINNKPSTASSKEKSKQHLSKLSVF